MSISIRKRLLQHLSDNKIPFTHALHFCASECNPPKTVKEILDLEKRLIISHRPPLNTQHNY